MVYIAYFTELILQICNYAQKRRIWRENCKYAIDENFHCHFCSRRKAAKFCHPEKNRPVDEEWYLRVIQICTFWLERWWRDFDSFSHCEIGWDGWTTWTFFTDCETVSIEWKPGDGVATCLPFLAQLWEVTTDEQWTRSLICKNLWLGYFC